MGYKLYQITSDSCWTMASRIDRGKEGSARKGEVFLGELVPLGKGTVRAKYGNHICLGMCKEL